MSLSYLLFLASKIRFSPWPVSPEEGFLSDAWVIIVTQWPTSLTCNIAMSTAESWEELLPARVWSSFDSRYVSLKPEQLFTFYLVPSHSALDSGMHAVSHHRQPLLDQRRSWPESLGEKKSCTIKCFLWGAVLYLATSWSEIIPSLFMLLLVTDPWDLAMWISCC